MMETYGAASLRTDDQVAGLVQALDHLGGLDNFYSSASNGASTEGGMDGTSTYRRV